MARGWANNIDRSTPTSIINAFSLYKSPALLSRYNVYIFEILMKQFKHGNGRGEDLVLAGRVLIFDSLHEFRNIFSKRLSH